MQWPLHIAGVLFAVALSACTAVPVRGDPCALPQADADWSVSTAEAAGFDAERLCQVLRNVAAGPANIHSLVVERRGALVAELYRSGRDRPQGYRGGPERSGHPGEYPVRQARL